MATGTKAIQHIGEGTETIDSRRFNNHAPERCVQASQRAFSLHRQACRGCPGPISQQRWLLAVRYADQSQDETTSALETDVVLPPRSVLRLGRYEIPTLAH